MDLRVGNGFDVHPFCDGRPLVLGGVVIPHHRGLQGHSDADVLLHAVIDALLGAASLGDIGAHFPDSDPGNRGRSVSTCSAPLSDCSVAQGFAVLNIDVTVLAEEPKIAPYRTEIQSQIAGRVGCAPGRIGIKATTTEKLGFIGRGEGMATLAICLISRREEEES